MDKRLKILSTVYYTEVLNGAITALNNALNKHFTTTTNRKTPTEFKSQVLKKNISSFPIAMGLFHFGKFLTMKQENEFLHYVMTVTQVVFNSHPTSLNSGTVQNIPQRTLQKLICCVSPTQYKI